MEHLRGGLSCLFLVLASTTFAETIVPPKTPVIPAPNTDARRGWYDLIAQNPEHAAQINRFIADLVRTAAERDVAAELDRNPVLREIRPELRAMYAREAEFILTLFRSQGFRELSPQTEGSLHRAVAAAVASAGVTSPIDPSQAHVFKINSGGVANAIMFTGKSSGQMIMVLFSGLETLLNESRLKISGVAGHEATHWALDHSRLIDEVLISYLILGEDVIDAERASDLNALKQERMASDLTARDAKALSLRENRIRARYEADRAALDAFYDKAARFRLDAKLYIPDERPPLLESIAEEGTKNLRQIVRSVREVLARRNAAGSREALTQVLGTINENTGRQKGQPLRFAELDVEALIRKLTYFIRSLEDSADHGEVLSAGVRASQEINFLLAGGRMFRNGRISDEALDQWIQQGAEARLKSAEDPAILAGVRDSEGTHSFSPDRARAVARFANTEAYATLKDFFLRHLELYVQVRGEYVNLSAELDSYGKGGPLDRLDSSMISNYESRAQRLASLAKGLEERVVQLVKNMNRGAGLRMEDNPRMLQILGVVKEHSTEITDPLIAALQKELRGLGDDPVAKTHSKKLAAMRSYGRQMNQAMEERDGQLREMGKAIADELAVRLGGPEGKGIARDGDLSSFARRVGLLGRFEEILGNRGAAALFREIEPKAYDLQIGVEDLARDMMPRLKAIHPELDPIVLEQPLIRLLRWARSARA